MSGTWVTFDDEPVLRAPRQATDAPRGGPPPPGSPPPDLYLSPGPPRNSPLPTPTRDAPGSPPPGALALSPIPEWPPSPGPPGPPHTGPAASSGQLPPDSDRPPAGPARGRETGPERRGPGLTPGSFSYVCERLERLRASSEAPGPAFVPRSLFHPRGRSGWALLLRIPEKKSVMSSRQWGPVFLRVAAGGVLQLFYAPGLERPFREVRLGPRCRLSEPTVERGGASGPVHAVKLEHVTYAERRRGRAGAQAARAVHADQLLKVASPDHGDFLDFLGAVEEELVKLPPAPAGPRPARPDGEREMFLELDDRVWAAVRRDGGVAEAAVVTRVSCLCFLNDGDGCFLTLDGPRPAPGPGDLHVHPCARAADPAGPPAVRFSPPDACRFELMRFRTAPDGAAPPLTLRAQVAVRGARVELRAFVRAGSPPACRHVAVRFPVPARWDPAPGNPGPRRPGSLRARMNRGARLGAGRDPDPEPTVRVSVGTARYEGAYRAVVWRIERLPDKNSGKGLAPRGGTGGRGGSLRFRPPFPPAFVAVGACPGGPARGTGEAGVEREESGARDGPCWVTGGGSGRGVARAGSPGELGRGMVRAASLGESRGWRGKSQGFGIVRAGSPGESRGWRGKSQRCGIIRAGSPRESWGGEGRIRGVGWSVLGPCGRGRDVGWAIPPAEVGVREDDRPLATPGIPSPRRRSPGWPGLAAARVFSPPIGPGPAGDGGAGGRHRETRGRPDRGLLLPSAPAGSPGPPPQPAVQAGARFRSGPPGRLGPVRRRAVRHPRRVRLGHGGAGPGHRRRPPAPETRGPEHALPSPGRNRKEKDRGRRRTPGQSRRLRYTVDGEANPGCGGGDDRDPSPRRGNNRYRGIR
uniref:Uncharacterized protein n=1 Tax=Ornithorhynchus anatinus TaxID=9258 RepID=A0A6I8P025_ORNAN